MNQNNEFNFDEFVNAVKNLGLLDKQNHATLHHSAVSTSDWNSINATLNQSESLTSNSSSEIKLHDDI